MQNFQAVVSTDGNTTFVALIYDDPQGIVSLVGMTVPQELTIGFDSGEEDGNPAADFSGAVREGRLTLEPVNIFRIDGWCFGVYRVKVDPCGRKVLGF